MSISSNLLLESFVLHSPIATGMFHGPELTLTMASKAFIKLFSLEEETMESIDGALLESGIQTILEKVYQSKEDHLEQEVLFARTIEGTFQESYFDLTFTALMDPDKKVIGVLVTGADVTGQVEARKQVEANEHRLSLAIQSAEMGTWEFYPQTLELKFNSRTRYLSGFDPAEPVTLAKTLEYIHPDDREQVQQSIAGATDPLGDGNFDSIYRVQLKNGKEIWVNSKGKTFFTDEGVPYFTTGILVDITENKLSELRKNDFIAMVSHELKTPLTGIKSFIQIALSRVTKTRDHLTMNALRRAEQQTNKMTKLIQGFLEINSLESGKIPLSCSHFSVKELFEEVVSDVLIIAPDRIFDIQCNGDMLYADRDKIGQAIFNLCSNAIKYSPPGSMIFLKSEQKPNSVQISVIDKGIGISEQDLPKLFERFYRVESDRVKFASGFGIGLYLSSEIIKHHQGTIGVESKEGEGSRFWFEIPGN